MTAYQSYYSGEEIRQSVILAVSGGKNPGKTTLIERILPGLKEKGIKIAVIKHD